LNGGCLLILLSTIMSADKAADLVNKITAAVKVVSDENTQKVLGACALLTIAVEALSQQVRAGAATGAATGKGKGKGKSKDSGAAASGGKTADGKKTPTNNRLLWFARVADNTGGDYDKAVGLLKKAGRWDAPDFQKDLAKKDGDEKKRSFIAAQSWTLLTEEEHKQYKALCAEQKKSSLNGAKGSQLAPAPAAAGGAAGAAAVDDDEDEDEEEADEDA